MHPDSGSWRGTGDPRRCRAFFSSFEETLVTDPYRVGLDILAQTGAGQDKQRNRVAEVAPDFVRLAVGFTYGEILSRPGLDLKLREFAAIATHAALRSGPAVLRAHVAAGLHLGWTRSEIIEVLIQIAPHAGIPATLQALSDCHDLLVEIDPQCSACQPDVSSTGQE